MRLTKLVLEKFKKVDKVEVDLHALNVLVGGNNSGKSSVLQGIHFCVIAAIASRIAGRDTYTQDSLLYCPALSFESLRHGSGYLNQSSFGHLRLYADFEEDPNAEYVVQIYRGRNEGNVGCRRVGSVRIGNQVASRDQLFSIYVPGLAGVSQFEQHRTESVVRRGVASGDANLYLRNVLLLIQDKGRLASLAESMRRIFPKFAIWISFDPANDIYIDVQVSTTGPAGRRCPLELAGTGVLQALQIFSYVTLFEPQLLLLDEPDSHLHPNNQTLLASALQETTNSTSTQIIVSTHSRHLVDALYEDANFVWLNDGKVNEQGLGLDRLPLLLELGALDSFDRLKNGEITWVILTEDRDHRMLQMLFENHGFSAAETLFYSYKTSTNLESAKILASFIGEIAPNTSVIIHRDRDFMTDDEVQVVTERIEQSGGIPFVTERSDVESYFLNPDHLAARLGIGGQDVAQWLDEIATDDHVELQHSFMRKRDDVKKLLYRGNPNDCPDTLGLLGAVIPLPQDRRHGKKMLKKVRAGMHRKFGVTVEVVEPSDHLVSQRLQEIQANA
jgi:energy-coupling factor transporter ATP-binding protein EcfA2